MRIVVIGGSTAGLKCACRVRRLLPGAAITVLDARREVSLAWGALPAFVAGELPSLAALRTTNYGRLRDEAFFRDIKDVELRTGWRAIAIDTAARTVSASQVDTGELSTLAYDHLVLATGAASQVPEGVTPGDRVFLGHDPLQLDALRRRLERGEVNSVAVLGGGCVGASLAAALVETWGARVTLFEAEDGLLPGVLDAELAGVAARALRDLGVTVVTGARVTAVTSLDGGAVVSAGGQTLTVDVVIVALGVVPRTELARAAGLAVGETGGLLAGTDLQCAEDVWACGDCVELTHAVSGRATVAGRSSLASRMGRIVAEGIVGRRAAMTPILGSFALRLGDTVVAATGLTAAAARAASLEPTMMIGRFPDRALLDPERRYDAVALVSEAVTGRLLGLQAVGTGAPIRRADLMATQLRAGGRLEDLLDLESCCHPAAGDLTDPLTLLAALAIAAREGGPRPSLGDDLPGAIFLDVREAHELTGELPALPGSMHIPLQELRFRADEIPRDRPVIAYCARGPRSIEAISVLHSKGICNIFYLAGGVDLRRIR